MRGINEQTLLRILGRMEGMLSLRCDPSGEAGTQFRTPSWCGKQRGLLAAASSCRVEGSSRRCPEPQAMGPWIGPPLPLPAKPSFH